MPYATRTPINSARSVPPLAAIRLCSIGPVASVDEAWKTLWLVAPKMARKFVSVGCWGNQMVPPIGFHSSCGLNAIVTIQ